MFPMQDSDFFFYYFNYNIKNFLLRIKLDENDIFSEI